jgi:hypothetical protein
MGIFACLVTMGVVHYQQVWERNEMKKGVKRDLQRLRAKKEQAAKAKS